MSKLWSKGYNIDLLIEAFTVGQDPILDRRLVSADCHASMAQAKMLASINIISKKEADDLVKALAEIAVLNAEEKFEIKQSDEDCHTAIEGHLTRLVGDAGKKIHTGRSRNDQVVTTIRLYAKESALNLALTGLQLVKQFFDFSEIHKDVPMPGRTHMQTAMPSSVGLWAASFAEELLDNIKHLLSVVVLINQSPLGAAASYGVPLPLDRELTSKLMGFEKVQNNVLYVNNSRGKVEAMLLDAYEYITLTLSKFAQDGILFSLPEFGYFSLPKELCTGSSIMPQKKNPDGLELMRAKAATLGAYSSQVKNIIRSLPSGYNRDFQDTKEPFIRGTELTELCLLMVNKTVESMEVNKEKLEQAFTPDIFATDLAIEKVQEGETFRDAYRYVGTHLNELSSRSPLESLKNRTSTGTPGNLNLKTPLSEFKKVEKAVNDLLVSHKKAMKNLAGAEISLI